MQKLGDSLAQAIEWAGDDDFVMYIYPPSEVRGSRKRSDWFASSR